ncbi:nitronate monooxygenase [Aspergillus homomorphus CBS 101889]|uniref:Inosine monophosphate dehydrogenase n=1 Tax=Aspergillus homomorphus (strain CBS 101889) TaxID=1450537 RepID=A0A395HQB6_ASPHC|nr:inosine monophosphate dehydrogenase [Aspergillus homomorphus CBS 101889]RAL10141.1 inosine monophosphate dehydrogenase [Aspergillus homomorphus CBS 101889]
MSSTTLLHDLPWLQSPIIANAPMSGFATSELAVAVTQAGGLGQIGFLSDSRALATQLGHASQHLQSITAQSPDNILPIGVGVICAGMSPLAIAPVLTQYKPAVVWLSFGEATDFAQWTAMIRSASPRTKIWIQIGSVKAAVGAAQACRPDALVIQGVDAGGHGHARGASLITLLPEVADALQAAGMGGIPLVAAGGIMDGRSTAAAVMLGAAVVTMGTRFLAAEETNVPAQYREALFRASDGGEATARSRVFDEMSGPSPWPALYDGRCLTNVCYENEQKGMSMEEVRAELLRDGDRLRETENGYRDTSSVWAGTGVGLMSKLEQAKDIVETVREDAKKRLRAGSAAF